jgi:septal ring-binding cell division protein DamX
MKNIAKISLSLLIVSIMLIGLAWAEESDSSKDESFEEE